MMLLLLLLLNILNHSNGGVTCKKTLTFWKNMRWEEEDDVDQECGKMKERKLGNARHNKLNNKHNSMPSQYLIFAHELLHRIFL
jgi:hypothetical protein